MSTLTIYLLGKFEVYCGDHLITPRQWRSRQNRTILKILLTNRGHVVSSDRLIDMLWPDDDPDSSRRRLHVRISQLRRVLDPDDPDAYVLTVEGGYTLNPEADCWIDAVEFEAHAKRGRRYQEHGGLAEAIATYEAAHSLYRGDFLEEDLYEDWTFVERERLCERFLTVLTELAECYAQQGRYRRAIACCQEVLARDNCREAVYVRLMLYQYYAGDQGRALRTYERCREMLARELEVEPLPQTSALAEQIRRREVEGIAVYPPPVYEGRLYEVPYSLGRTPFVGRGEEYGWLVSQVEEVLVGRGGMVVVSGEAGVGKTRLVQEVLGYARQRRVTVLEGRCAELESSLSYQPLVQALRGYLPTADVQHLRQVSRVWLAEVAKLLPELSETFPDLPPNDPLPPEHQKSRLFEAVAQFIVHASREPPLIIFLDDLHWADRPTLELLHYLARRTATEKVLFIGAFRSEEVGEGHPLAELVRGMSREQLLTRLVLQPLSVEAVTELIAQMSHSSAGGRLFSQRIYRETQGNPLFIVAILQNLFEEGVLYVNEEGEWATEYDESTVDYAELMLPPTIREVIEARLVRLDEGGRRILALASVLGQNFALDLLQRVSGRTEEKLFEVLDDLMRRHLIQEESRARGYRFDHPKVREVIYAGLDAPQRAALHRRVGEVLEEQHPGDLQAVAERLAHHFRLAAEAPKTVEYSIMAGQEALWMCAHQEASEHFRQALASAEEASLSLTPAQQLAIQQGLGEAHWMAGRYDQARACYEEAMSYADAETAAECEALLFKAFYLDAQRGAPISSLLRRAKAFESKLEEVQDPLAKAHHWLQKGYALLIQGVADQARECYHRGWEIISNLASTGEEGRYTSDLAEAHRALGEAHLWWGDYERGARDLERALSLYQETGDVLAIMRSRLLLGELLVRSGAWGPALANLSQVVETATRVEHPPLLGEALIRLAHVHTDQGDWGSAEAEALRGQAIAQEVGDLRCQGGAQLLLNRILIKRGEAGQALPSCQAMEAMIRASGSGLYLCLALRYLSEAYVSLGEPEKALVHCREGLELACAAGSKREIGAIQRIWGEALVQQGRWDEAEARLQASVELLERAGIPYELGESRRSLGKLYRERGAAKAARQHLDAALALFENLGAKHDAAVTRQLISDLECLLWPGPACRQAGLAQRVGGEERPTGEG